ncbi:MAG: Selenide, water dikinase [Clostridia bacterium 41_269]|nr:MAG: Selenide, water dikinase [Clostridia bacterium 41_269]
MGFETSDDAAVYKLDPERAVVQTVDYFTPVVDDPYTFGLIAAANALSDIYAMGAEPIFALNIIGFPVGKLPLKIMGEILRGGKDKAEEAGIPILGGHSIKDAELKYGLVVTGIVNPDKILTNRGAKPGDKLVLTKPLGIGIMTHAIKKDFLSPQLIELAVKTMTALNDKASKAAVEIGVNACTDVTGFGLLGHLNEMLEASGCGAVLELKRIPVLCGEVWELAEKGIVPGGGICNLDFLEGKIKWDEKISRSQKLVLSDPQTSGGLLISVADAKTERLIEKLNDFGTAAYVVGKVVKGKGIKVLG